MAKQEKIYLKKITEPKKRQEHCSHDYKCVRINRIKETSIKGLKKAISRKKQ